MLKTVYIAISADLIHPRHVEVIRRGSELGAVTVGLLTDRAVGAYKRLPVLSYEQRQAIIENIKGVTSVIAQDSEDFVPNVRKLRPDYVVHGDDWRTGLEKQMRESVIAALGEWSGQLVELVDAEETAGKQQLYAHHRAATTPDIRRSMLRRQIAALPIVRVMEAHNGLTGLIVENTRVTQPDGKSREFDALWISSLTDSTAKGKADRRCKAVLMRQEFSTHSG